MQAYYCKCGTTQSYGSSGPSPCMSCDHCGTHPTLNGISQPYMAEDHKWYKQQMDTDSGVFHLTICSYCGIKKKEYEKNTVKI